MKMHTRNNVGAALVLLGGLAGASSAQAIVATIPGTLGFSASSTDHYHVLCPIGATNLRGRVRDNFPVLSPLVSLQIHKGVIGTTAANTTDPVDGGALFFSPWVSVRQGAGFYDVLVDKTGPGAEVYTMQVECQLGFIGLPTIVFPIIQDQ